MHLTLLQNVEKKWRRHHVWHANRRRRYVVTMDLFSTKNWGGSIIGLCISWSVDVSNIVRLVILFCFLMFHHILRAMYSNVTILCRLCASHDT